MTLPPRCPGCGTAPATHDPYSPECAEARLERHLSQSDDGDD